MSSLRRADVSAAPAINEDNIGPIEDEALERAGRTISVLDSSLSQWDMSGQSPAELRPQFNQYRIVFERIGRWAVEEIKSKGREPEMELRLKRLRDYVEIYYSLKVVQ